MIKMVKVINTLTSVPWDIREEFYEKYKEDFTLVSRFEVMDETERLVSVSKEVHAKEDAELKAKEEAKAKAVTSKKDK